MKKKETGHRQSGHNNKIMCKFGLELNDLADGWTDSKVVSSPVDMDITNWMQYMIAWLLISACSM